jgi:Polyketide cyclase / dehydrase and lipid transport
MPRVSHHFVVDRPIEAVFAVVSTARFWPEWHPFTRDVEGDIDHPARLGDRITEHVTIAGVERSDVWTVTEHTPPHRVAFEAELPVGHQRIAYEFTKVPDVGTRFQRDLDFPELGPEVYAEMEARAVQGVNHLARLVEREIPAPDSDVIG